MSARFALLLVLGSLCAVPATAQSPLPVPVVADTMKVEGHAAPAPAAVPGFADTTTFQSPLAPPVAPTADIRVGRVSVVGNVVVDSTRILRSFDVPSGSRFSEEAVRRGFRKLFALGLFDDIQIERQPRDAFMDLVIKVKERPKVGAIRFVGNKRRQSDDLEGKLALHVGDIYSPVQVQTQSDSLVRYYHGEGFSQAIVLGRADTTGMKGEVAVIFDITEGERVKIERIEFIGVTQIPPGTLQKNLKSKPKGLLGGGEIKDENLAEDREKLERYYKSHGYRDMHIASHELVPGSSPNRLVLRVTVDEGRRYTFGRIAWSGNKLVSTIDLQRMWPPSPKTNLYDITRIEKAQGQAYADYAEKGYLYVGIDPRETVHDDSLVDVTFAIQEGRPSNVRYVVISGNKNTREHVIRREISIHEGDQFQRSALVRTQGDIFRLGIFEDVGIDFTPAESTDVDIQLKVKEKQVGTASAGAGYTAESGVTGFLELGHNNVLGNAQTLQLHLERGGRRSDYSLSFTEPWFRGTPTLLGISMFNSSRDRDVYSEHRVGGAVRVGRPLPWPDYSRGSVAYAIENVTLDSLGLLTPADRIALRGLNLGVPTLTSSVELNASRNNTNNPFYPTKGSRFLVVNEFAGGPIGGSVDFDKFRAEGRVYLRGLTPFMTTMVRARFGVLMPLESQKPVPDYERFRLGGGTTVDPLRGYDDYQVVPSQYIVRAPIAYRPDTTISGPDTTVTQVPIAYQTVRYPGGRFMLAYTVEQQFPIMAPLRGVLFFDAGNTWDRGRDVKPTDVLMGAGGGLRMEIPLLGNVGFDYGYGFNRDDGDRWVGYLLIGNVNF